MKKFTGLYTALITPFKNNKFDENAFAKIIEKQIAGGVDGIIPCGTTGESPTLDHDEHNRVVELAINIANKRVKILAGTGSNSTTEAIKLTESALEAGADGALICSPYYNKPSPAGIYSHYSELNEIGIPIIIYNIPSRSVIDIDDNNIAKLAELKNIAGLKDATGDLSRVAKLRSKLGKINDNFSLLSGEDITTVGFNAMGGNGVISVTANIVPEICASVQKYSLSGDYKKALMAQEKITELHIAMFIEPNPVMAKYAACIVGLCSDEVRKPLVPAQSHNKKIMADILQKLKLI